MLDQILPSIILGTVIFIDFILYSKWKENKEIETIKQNEAEERKKNPPVDNTGEVTRTMTLDELAQYDGVKNPNIYLAVKNQVFDVTNSEFYKPGAGDYSKLAGHECSVALAKMSTDLQYMNCYETTKLALAEVDVLESWYARMKQKYKIVATIAGTKKDN